MSIKSIRPSTIDGIKRLAKDLKVRDGVGHMKALDTAAMAAGFQNFRHAKNCLRDSLVRSASSPRHHLYLTAYWKDTATGTAIRETLVLSMSAPWSELLAQAQLGNHWALMYFRPEASDHLAREILLRTQSAARRAVCAAARALQFMDATRLRPSKSYSRAYPGGRPMNAIPGKRHPSVWFDPGTKRYLLVDEPYDEDVDVKLAERQAWAQEHGFVVTKPEWAGIYAPDLGTRLYLVAHQTKGVPLEPIVEALGKIPAPVVEKAWNGESAPMFPIFFSPGASTRTVVAKKEKAGTLKPSGPRNTVGYVQMFVGPRRRPKTRMPIEAHAEVARLLKSVLAVTHERKGVYNRVDAVRCDLDDWTQREYSREELPSEQFFEMHYDGSAPSRVRALSEANRVLHGESLLKVKGLLTQHYPDCPPLRVLLKKLDAAQTSLQAWT